VRAGANPINVKLFLCRMNSEKNIEHPTSNVEWEEMKKTEIVETEIGLWSAATTRFDVRRWAFDVGRSSVLKL